MTAAADCTVDHHQPGFQIQELQNFPDENGTMDGRAGIVAGRRRIGHWDGAKALCGGKTLGKRNWKTGRFRQSGHIRTEGFGNQRLGSEKSGLRVTSATAE
jgi:hypothetical protein